jgi:hypothetical protein
MAVSSSRPKRRTHLKGNDNVLSHFDKSLYLSERDTE